MEREGVCVVYLEGRERLRTSCFSMYSLLGFSIILSLAFCSIYYLTIVAVPPLDLYSTRKRMRTTSAEVIFCVITRNAAGDWNA